MSDTLRPTTAESPAVILPSRMMRLPTRRAVPEAVPEHVNVHRPSSARVNCAGAEVEPSFELADAEAVIVPTQAPANGRKSSGGWAALLAVADADSTDRRLITTTSRLTPHLPASGSPGARASRAPTIVRRFGPTRIIRAGAVGLGARCRLEW